jgi:hypothetical protein
MIVHCDLQMEQWPTARVTFKGRDRARQPSAGHLDRDADGAALLLDERLDRTAVAAGLDHPDRVVASQAERHQLLDLVFLDLDDLVARDEGTSGSCPSSRSDARTEGRLGLVRNLDEFVRLRILWAHGVDRVLGRTDRRSPGVDTLINQLLMSWAKGTGVDSLPESGDDALLRG